LVTGRGVGAVGLGGEDVVAAVGRRLGEDDPLAVRGEPDLVADDLSVKCVIWVRAVPSGWTVKKLPFPDSSSATARKTIRFVEDQSGVPSAPADHGVS